MRFLMKAFLGLSLLGMGLAGWAGEYLSGRNVTQVGCHNTNSVCYVTLNGNSFGGTLGCTQSSINQFRFDNGDTATGRTAYSSFLAAMLGGKSVIVYLDGCTSQGYPKLSYFSING